MTRVHRFFTILLIVSLFVGALPALALAQEQVRLYRGKLHWEGDLDALREGRFADVDR